MGGRGDRACVFAAASVVTTISPAQLVAPSIVSALDECRHWLRGSSMLFLCGDSGGFLTGLIVRSIVCLPRCFDKRYRRRYANYGCWLFAQFARQGVERGSTDSMNTIVLVFVASCFIRISQHSPPCSRCHWPKRTERCLISLITSP